MSRLIDADKLSEHKFTRESAKGSDYMRGWNDAIDAIIENEPTVEYQGEECVNIKMSEEDKQKLLSALRNARVTGVVESERAQGKWIDTGNMEEYWAEEYQCSICGAKDHWHHYCPNCGAYMGESEDEDYER